MSAQDNLKRVVSVTLSGGASTVALSDLNRTAILTSEVGVLSSSKRYGTYLSSAAVDADYGSNSQTAAFARTFFGTTPNPSTGGSPLIIGFWRKEDENVPDSAAVLTSAPLDLESTFAQVRSISDGAFDIDVDGTTVVVASLDLRSATNMDDVAAAIDTALTGASAVMSGPSLVITSDTSGAASTLTFASDSGAGTYLGDILSISNGSGAVIVNGAAAEVLPAESQVEALTALRDETRFYGAAFIDAVVDVAGVAAWAQANSVLVYETFSGESVLDVDVANPVWLVTSSSQHNMRCLYSINNNRHFAIAYMSRLHTVNFNAANTALTMHLKSLPIPAEDLTDTIIDSALRVGLDIYISVDTAPSVFCSPANSFADEIYNLMGLQNALQVNVFNRLRGTAGAIPQTDQGIATLVSTCEQTATTFVTAGVLAPGTWTSPDMFGDPGQFSRAIESQGYFFLAQPLSAQSRSSRENREAPPINGAVKLAGAVHSADVLVVFNR